MADEVIPAQWGTLSLDLPPPFLVPIIDAINSVFEVIIAILDIVMVILQIVKVFVIGLISPIIPLLEAIIALLEGLLDDLRNAGFYIRGDWDELNFAAHKTQLDSEKTMEQLEGMAGAFKQYLGGFGKFEGRVVQWLTDTTDPGRPVFSANAGVLGMFFVVGCDISGIIKAISAFLTLLKFFGQMNFDGAMLTTPTSLEVKYQPPGGALGAFINMGDVLQGKEPPTEGLLEWKFSTPPGMNPLLASFPPLPPEACLIEISTIKDGLIVGFSAPAGTAAMKSQPGFSSVETRRHGLYKLPVRHGGGPLRLFGGPDVFTTDAALSAAGYKFGASGEPAAGATCAFAIKDPLDPKPISLKKWKDEVKSGKKHIMQRAFVVDSRNLAMMAGGHSFLLKRDHMPHALKDVEDGKPIPEDEPATEVFVRVTPLSPEGFSTYGSNYTEAKEGSLGQDVVHADGEGVQWAFGIGTALGVATCRPNDNDRGPTSKVLKIDFPSAGMLGFAKAVRAAFYIACCVRPDKTEPPNPQWTRNTTVVPKDGEIDTGLEPVAERYRTYLTGPRTDMDEFHSGMAQEPSWRSDCRFAADRFISDFMRLGSAIPNSALEALYERHGKLLVEEDVYKAAADATAHHGYPTGISDKTLKAGTFEDGKITVIGLMETRSSWWGFGRNPYSTSGFEGQGWQSQVTTAAGTAYYQGANNLTPRAAMRGGILKMPAIWCQGSAMASGTTSMGQAALWGPGMAEELATTLVKEGRLQLIPLRNFFPQEYLDAAAAILAIASKAPIKGNWIAVRPLAGVLYPVEEIMEQIIATVKAIRDGLLALLEEILKYIRMIESRIMEIQQFIRKIQQLFNMFKDFSISADLGLLMVASAGTDGLLTDFLAADNKPDIPGSSYCMGGVVIAGGLPVILLELLQAIIVAASDDEEEEEEG
jgi:hypothetical protein